MEDPTKLDSSGNENKTEIKANTTADIRAGEFVADTTITLDTSSFYFPSTVLMAATAFALAGYAYYVSLAGKKVFGDGKFFDTSN